MNLNYVQFILDAWHVMGLYHLENVVDYLVFSILKRLLVQHEKLTMLWIRLLYLVHLFFQLSRLLFC